MNESPDESRGTVVLRFTDKFFLASGAGNGNFALAPGNPHHLAALGAIEVAILPVLDPGNQLQKLPVFQITLIGIPGQTAENSPDHQAVA